MKAALLGTGAIGGGVVVPFLLERLDVDVTVVARNEERAREIARQPLVVVTASEEGTWERRFNLPQAISETDQEAMGKLLSDPDLNLVFTAVRSENLPTVAQVLGRALSNRRIGQPIFILPFENVPHSGPVLLEQIRRSSPLHEWAGTVLAPAVVVDCMSFRRPSDCTIVREPYREVIVQRTDPQLEELLVNHRLSFVDDTRPYYQRKIALVSGVHTALAWMGMASGIERVNDAARTLRQSISELVEELAEGVSLETGFPSKELIESGMRTVGRVANPHLPDECSKFTRGLPGKLGPAERFGFPAVALWEKRQQVPKALCEILALGFSLSTDDPERRECLSAIEAFPPPLAEHIKAEIQSLGC